MKKILIIWLLAMALPLTAAAQKVNFQSLFDKYNGVEGYTTVEITGEMLKLMGGKDSDSSGTFDGISMIRVIVSERPSDTFTDDIKQIAGPDHKLMTLVNDGGQQIMCYFRENYYNRRKSEFLIIGYGDKENMALSITGDIDIKKISGLSGIKFSGMDKLE